MSDLYSHPVFKAYNHKDSNLGMGYDKLVWTAEFRSCATKLADKLHTPNYDVIAEMQMNIGSQTIKNHIVSDNQLIYWFHNPEEAMHYNFRDKHAYLLAKHGFTMYKFFDPDVGCDVLVFFSKKLIVSKKVEPLDPSKKLSDLNESIDNQINEIISIAK